MIPRIDVVGRMRARVAPRARRSLARRLHQAGRRLGLSARELGGLGVRIVGDEEMAGLHERFLGEAQTTDVLSFPVEPAATHGDPELPLLGDVVLCWDAVVRQARSPGAQAQLDEATVLCVHGIVHLLGHDHGTRAAARAMRRLERRALRACGLSRARI